MFGKGILALALIASHVEACTVSLTCMMNGRDCNSNAPLAVDDLCSPAREYTVKVTNTANAPITLNSAIIDIAGEFSGYPADIVEDASFGFQGTIQPNGMVSLTVSAFPSSICEEKPPELEATIDIVCSNGQSDSAVYTFDIAKKCLPGNGVCGDDLFSDGDSSCCSNECLPSGKCKNAAVIGFPCFSGDSTVQAEDGTMVAMKDLKIGDKIVNANGALDRLYGFGHYSPNTQTEFLQIKMDDDKKSVLELTENHLLFRKDGVAVPASSLRLGDEVKMVHGQAAKVERIRTVVRTGVFAPFTDSGTVAVNHVAASSFINLKGDDSAFVTAAGYELPFTWHWVGQTSQAPHRFMCALNFEHYCQQETYTEEGISRWNDMLHRLAIRFAKEDSLVIAIPCLMVTLVVAAAEYLLTNAHVSALLVVGMTMILRRQKKNKQVVV